MIDEQYYKNFDIPVTILSVLHWENLVENE